MDEGSLMYINGCLNNPQVGGAQDQFKFSRHFLKNFDRCVAESSSTTYLHGPLGAGKSSAVKLLIGSVHN